LQGKRIVARRDADASFVGLAVVIRNMYRDASGPKLLTAHPAGCAVQQFQGDPTGNVAGSAVRRKDVLAAEGLELARFWFLEILPP